MCRLPWLLQPLGRKICSSSSCWAAHQSCLAAVRAPAFPGCTASPRCVTSQAPPGSCLSALFVDQCAVRQDFCDIRRLPWLPQHRRKDMQQHLLTLLISGAWQQSELLHPQDALPPPAAPPPRRILASRTRPRAPFTLSSTHRQQRTRSGKVMLLTPLLQLSM